MNSFPPGLSPVHAHQRNLSIVDFPSRMSAVFFLSGCNFRCGFCHNAQLLSPASQTLTWKELSKICRDFEENWVRAAVITGGEPTLQETKLSELIDFFKKRGWSVKLDTNGSRPRVLEHMTTKVDYVAMDVKIDLAGYADLTGFSDTDNIRESIDIIQKTAPEYEFRTTVIPGVHTEKTMKEISCLLSNARSYVLQPFVPRDDLPDPKFRTTRRTDPDFMKNLAQSMKKNIKNIRVRNQ